MEDRRAVLFDLDGTLLDPHGSIRATIDHVLKAAGLPPVPADQVLVGMPLRDILRLRTRDPARVEAMVAHYRKHFGSRTWRLVRWVPGMQELVRRLRQAGVATAVVTTKGEEEAERLLEDLGAGDLFDTVVGDDDARPLKPDPAPVLAACGRLAVPPHAAAMVGDTSFDVKAGRAAGAFTVGVLWGHGGEEAHWDAGADAVAQGPEGLELVLRRWLEVTSSQSRGAARP